MSDRVYCALWATLVAFVCFVSGAFWEVRMTGYSIKLGYVVNGGHVYSVKEINSKEARDGNP